MFRWEVEGQPHSWELHTGIKLNSSGEESGEWIVELPNGKRINRNEEEDEDGYEDEADHTSNRSLCHLFSYYNYYY